MLLLFLGLISLTQDIQIFPGVFDRRSEGYLPSGVQQVIVRTADDELLEAWRVAGKGDFKGVAVIAHGNGGTVEFFFPYQEWLAEMGITSFGFDYRGFGYSTGWPSHRGLLLDTETVLKEAARREGVAESDIIFIGISIGTGIAATEAARVGAKTVVLFSPYTSLDALVRSMPLVGLAAPLLNYRYSTIDSLRAHAPACLIIAHGKQDTTIPFYHAVQLKEALSPHSVVHLVASERAGHNDLFFAVASGVGAALLDCVN